MVQYNLTRVREWFECVERDLSSQEFSALWIQLAFHPDEPVGVDPHLLRSWSSFSRWEQQAALYMFGPVLKRFAAEQAYKRSQAARQHEPL